MCAIGALAACTSATPIAEQPVAIERSGGVPAFDHALLDEVLDRFVSSDGLVDYAALRINRSALDRYVGQVAAASPDSHPELFPSPEHEMAYWINAYNAVMLHVVIESYPIASVLDIRAGHGVFRRIAYPLGRVPMTLDDVEHEVLLARYDEPRVHFALTCASRSCPRLAPFALAGSRLDMQLDAKTRAFLRSVDGLRVDVAENRVWLSPIFDWYADDFPADVLGYVRPYLDTATRDALEALDEPSIEYLDYDWGLNSASARP